jgi:GT2 family glycosyltransferase
MSALWSGTGAKSKAPPEHSEPWRPVALIQVDVESLPREMPSDVTPGARVWVEGFKQGQVVGVMETRAGTDVWPTPELERWAKGFDDLVVTGDHLPDERLPKASVVVPTICKTPKELVRTVDSLLDMEYPDFEIIVVDNRSAGRRDPLPTFRGGAKVVTSAEPKRGISAARNHGVAMASGDFVAFTDDDAVADRGWLRALGTRFVLDDEVDGIGGAVLPLGLDTPAQLWFEEYYGGFSQSFRAEKLSIRLTRGTDKLFPYAPGRFGAGCNMAFRRSTLERLGGFNDLLGTGTPAKGGEDLALFFDLVVSGGTIAFEPGALVRHSHRRTEQEFMRQVCSYGTGLTAMYTACVVTDPRHIGAMIRRLPPGLRLLVRPREHRSASGKPSYPRSTLVFQLLGMMLGPFAYARSVAKARWFT